MARFLKCKPRSRKYFTSRFTSKIIDAMTEMMRTRKRLSSVVTNEPSCLKICHSKDYNINNLSLNLQTIWTSPRDRSNALIIGTFLQIKQGIWFDILPSNNKVDTID